MFIRPRPQLFCSSATVLVSGGAIFVAAVVLFSNFFLKVVMSKSDKGFLGFGIKID